MVQYCAKRYRTGIAQSIPVFFQFDSRVGPITPQGGIEWVMIQSPTVKVSGLVKLVRCRMMYQEGNHKLVFEPPIGTGDPGWRDSPGLQKSTYRQRLCWLLA